MKTTAESKGLLWPVDETLSSTAGAQLRSSASIRRLTTRLGLQQPSHRATAARPGVMSINCDATSSKTTEQPHQKLRGAIRLVVCVCEAGVMSLHPPLNGGSGGGPGLASRLTR